MEPAKATLDIFKLFNLNIHAWHYFGIICFNDLPGIFPGLGIDDD